MTITEADGLVMSLTESSVSETLTWDTQSEFDAGVYTWAYAESGVLKLGLYDDVEDGDASEWTAKNGSVGTSTDAYEGSYSLTTDGPSNWDGAASWDHSTTITSEDVYMEGRVQHTNGEDEHPWLILHRDNGSNSHYLLDLNANTDDLSLRVVDQGSKSDVSKNSVTVDYDKWYRNTFYYDRANDQFECEAFDPSGNSILSFTASDSTITREGVVGLGCYRNTAEWDNILARKETGDWESATKTFSAQTKPDLQNLSYTLNGETISLDVIGSPGTASEEVVTQALDGASSYDLTWSNSHTDFRVRPNFTTSDPRETNSQPTVSALELVST